MSLARSLASRLVVLTAIGSALMLGGARAQDASLDRLLVEECWRGNTEKVAALLKQGASPNAVRSGGRTALHLAASRGYVEVMRLLIDKGADLNAKDILGRTAMGDAVGNHDPAAVKVLLAAKAKPDNFSLGQAAWLGRVETAKLLLDAGHDPSTGIVRAAQGGHAGIVQLLLERGASIQAKLADGNTALHLGALQGGLETVQLLLRSKADANAVNNQGRTPLHMAISGDGELKTIQLLVASGARLDIPDKELVTPVRLAAHRGDKTVYAWLLAANGGKEPEVAELAAEAKRMGAKTPQELIAALSSRNETEFVAAEREVVRRGRKIMPELLRSIESGTAIEHFYDLFAVMGPSAESALPLLESKLGDKRHVWNAAITIERIKPAALDKLNDETSRKAQAALYEAIIDPDADVMASYCANILVRLGNPAKPTILRLLSHPQTEPRRRMVSELENARFDDAELAVALRNLTKADQPASVRTAAAKTLGRFGEPSQETKAALFAVIEHRPIETGNEPEEAKMNAEQGWRSAADTAARSLRRFGPEIIEELIPLLSPMSAPQRSPAITTLASLGPPAVPRLIELLGHEDRAVAISASVALNKIGAPAATALSQAVRTGNVQVVDHASNALWWIGPGAKAALPVLLEVAGSKDRLDATRVAAARAALKIDPNNNASPAIASTVPALIRILEKGPFRHQAWAAETARGIGTGARDALPALRKCLELPPRVADAEGASGEWVHHEAKQAIAAIEKGSRE